ncbi:MAG: matrixin family metalloprotease, partial [Caldilineaceae bacterium]
MHRKRRSLVKVVITVLLIWSISIQVVLAQDNGGNSGKTLYLPFLGSSIQSTSNGGDDSSELVQAAAVQPFGVKPRRNPSTSITYRFDTSFSNKGTDWTNAFASAAADWSSSTVSIVSNSSSSNVIKVAEIPSDPNEPVGANTTSNYSISGSYLTNFVITVDPTPGTFTWYTGTGTPPIGSTQLDLKTFLRHELGHALGLEHNASSGTLMYETLATQTILTPSAADRNGIKYLYDATYSGTPDPSLCEYSLITAVGTYDNPSLQLGYGGSANWVSATGFPKAYNGSVSYVNNSGARYWIVFQGSTITRRYTMAPNRSGVEIFIDGVSKGTMNDYSPYIHWQAAKTWEVSSGSPHILEVRGTGSNYFDADAFVINTPHSAAGTYNNPGIGASNVIGTWTTYSGTGPFNNDVIYSKNAQDAIYFTFKGTSITYYYTKDFNRGKADVTIDGVSQGLVDLWSPSTVWCFCQGK